MEEHLHIELVKNDDVALLAIGEQEYHITPDSFAVLSEQIAQLANESGTAHLTLQLSPNRIPFEEVDNE